MQIKINCCLIGRHYDFKVNLQRHRFEFYLLIKYETYAIMTLNVNIELHCGFIVFAANS